MNNKERSSSLRARTGELFFGRDAKDSRNKLTLYGVLGLVGIIVTIPELTVISFGGLLMSLKEQGRHEALEIQTRNKIQTIMGTQAVDIKASRG